LRLLSVLLGAATVPLAGALGAELFDRRAGLVGAALLALAPAHIFYSRDARMYPLLGFLVVLALYALVRATRSGGARWWVLWAVASLAAVATHYYAAFVFAGEAVYLLLARLPGRAARLALAGTALAALAALVAWWALAPGLRHSLGGLRLAPLAPEEALASVWWAAAGVLRGPLGDEPAPLDHALGALALALLAIGACLAWQRRRAGATLALAAGLLPALGLAALMLLGRDLNVRFVLLLLPLALVTLAAGWLAVWPGRWGAAALVTAWAAIALLWLVPYYGDYVRGDYALALREVEASEQAGEAVVFNGPWQTLLFDHYYRGALPGHILTGAVPLVEAQVATALADLDARYQGLWLLETDMGHADPTGFVPRWLARYAYRERIADYRQVRLSHYLPGGSPARVVRLDAPAGAVSVVEVRVDPRDLAPGQLGRLELVWRAGEDFEPGVKASLRLREDSGTIRWATDVWLAESWLADRPPHGGDLLYTRVAIAADLASPLDACTLEIVVYASTDRPESGEGWVAWSAPPIVVALGSPGADDLAVVAPTGPRN